MNNYEQLHEQLMKEFRAYFDDYQDWARFKTHTAGMRTRAHLSEIRRIGRALRDDILETRRTFPKIKSPAYKAAKLAEDLALKQQAQGDTDTN
jgi:hypothetical protein